MPTDFARTRALFDLPPGLAYLDGNSLGPLPRAARARMDRVLREWGHELIGGWNRCGWMDLPLSLGDRIGRLIGAAPGHTVVGDTLSIRVYQALAAALALNPTRRIVLSDTGNFPSDLYMAEGLLRTLGEGYALRLAEPEALEDAITEEVAVLLVTEVDYRTGRRHDLPRLTARAHAMGALAVWDLAHSAGAFPVGVDDGGADFAVGCTYKFLNGGPGAPAFLSVAPRHAEAAPAALQGWLGHRAPFAFDLAYAPAAGVGRFRVGTPPVLAMAALDAALDVWEGVDLHDLRARSLELGDRLIRGALAVCPDLSFATPPEPALRGSQVSFRHPEGYAAMQALIARGVVGDFRAPDIMRFGITPLYLGEAEIDRAVEALAEVMGRRLWEDPAFRRRAAVT